MSLIETQVIASIIESGNVAAFLEAGLTTNLLAHKPERAKELAWILDHNSKFGKVPSPERFKDAFPGFVCPKRSVDNPAEIVADVKASSVDHKTRSIISEMVAMGQEKKTSAMDMFTLLKKKVSEVEESVNPSRDLVVNSKEFVDEFMGDYRERQLTNGVSGVPWPWPTANAKTLGLQPDDLVLFLARPGVGKTWALVVLADFLWQSGYSVLFVSNELTALRLAQRQVAKTLGIGYHDLRAGSKDALEIQDLVEKQVLLSGRKNFIITANDDGMGAGGVSFLDSKIRKYNPDVVVVDAAYLMNDDLNGKNENERAGNVVRQLKALNKRCEKTIFASWQNNREADGKTKAEDITTKFAGLSDKVGQDASYMITLVQTEDDRHRKQMQAHFNKTRDSGKFTLSLVWDFDTMCFDEMIDDDFGVGSEGGMSVSNNASGEQTDIEDTDWSNL